MLIAKTFLQTATQHANDPQRNEARALIVIFDCLVVKSFTNSQVPRLLAIAIDII